MTGLELLMFVLDRRTIARRPRCLAKGITPTNYTF
jgi:hypothetical protein